MRFVAISGYARSGKSRLISLIIKDFSRRGMTVCVLKRAEEIELRKHEREFISSGAKSVIIISPKLSLAAFNRKLELRELVPWLKCDFLLMEGFKKDPFPKVLVVRDESEALELSDEWTIAITSFNKEVKVRGLPFVFPEKLPDLLLQRSPYFPLWMDCGKCGHKKCISFLRNSMGGEPIPCPATSEGVGSARW